ncbi:MAG: hypothetical protein AB8B96_04860 [Lysobacterales bacterium]
MAKRLDRQRQLIANEAARIVVEQSVRDLHAAKLKAAERLGLSSHGKLPANTDIEAAIHSHLALFGGADHNQHLQTLREAALEGVQFFSDFHARLVGPVLAGTADRNSPVTLHVFSDSPESIALFLGEQGIPFDETQRRLRVSRERHETFLVYQFMAGEVAIELTALPLSSRRQAPLSPVDGKPMRRAGVAEIQAL